MPFLGPTPAEIDRLVDAALATQPVEELADVFPTSMTFSQIEQLAARLGQRLTCRLTEQALAQQAATLSAEVACPQCGNVCRLTRHPRRLTTAAGQVTYHEPASHCESCRRDFFP
jgi:hypothetical protein